MPPTCPPPPVHSLTFTGPPLRSISSPSVCQRRHAPGAAAARPAPAGAAGEDGSGSRAEVASAPDASAPTFRAGDGAGRRIHSRCEGWERHDGGSGHGRSRAGRRGGGGAPEAEAEGGRGGGGARDRRRGRPRGAPGDGAHR